MIYGELKSAVKTVGPALLIMVLILLYVYDQCVAAPLRSKVCALENSLSSINSTVVRIDERTRILFIEKFGKDYDSIQKN